MKKLPIITTKKILSWNPCNEARPFIPKGWKGTVLDILAYPVPKDGYLRYDWIIWLVTNEKCYPNQSIANRILRLLACDCAERALKKCGDNPDPRSINAVKVARRFANGNATEEELAAARAAAGYAAGYAAGAAARAAARAAAGAAAGAAARAAARDAAGAAAWDAAGAARAAENKWQLKRLKKITERELT